ncbi:MAG: hypothetical protein K9H58_16300 [Bacteroidales bacterium]|nr:hypothetical protein [Bacteroidales bacterium]
MKNKTFYFILPFALLILNTSYATHWWTGAVNHSWNNGGNWDMGTVPGSSDDVFIPSGTPNDCWVATTDQDCDNLFVLAGATLRIYDEILHVWGVCEIYGNLKMDNSIGELHTHQNFRWYSGSTANITAYALIVAYKDWEFRSGATVHMNNGYVKFFGYSVPNNIICKSSDSYFSTISIENPYGVEFSTSSTQPLVVDNLIHINPSMTFTSNSSQDIICNGQFDGYPGEFNFNNGTFIFNGTSSVLDCSFTSYFNNLTINTTGFIEIGFLGWLNIMGDLHINSGILDCDYSGWIRIYGDWINNVGTGGFDELGSTVEFLGASYQKCSNETFYKLIINKTGNYMYPEAGHTIQVTNSLELADGDLQMNTNSSLDLNGEVIIANGSKISANGVSGTNIYFSGIPWDDNNTSTSGFIPGTSTFTFDHSSGYHGVNTDAFLFSFYNLNISGAGAVAISENIEVLGDVNVNNGSWLDYGSTGLYHMFYGDITVVQSSYFTDEENILFKGTSDQIISGGNNGLTLGHLIIDKGNKTSGGSKGNTVYFSANYPGVDLQVESLTIDYGTLQMNSAKLTSLGNINVNSGAKLALDAWCWLEIEDGKNVNINSLGTFESIGSAEYMAVVSHTSAGYYGFNVNSGGTIAAKYTVFEYIDDFGVNIKSGSFVDANYPFDYCEFRNGESGGTLLMINTSQGFSVANAKFPANTWSGLFNVVRESVVGNVVFKHATGDFAGESFDFDPNNNVNWDYTPTLFNTKIFLEGPFNGTAMNTDVNPFLPLNQPYNGYPWYYNGTESVPVMPSTSIVDWVLLELRTSDGDVSTANDYCMVAQQAAFLMNNGNVVDTDGSFDIPIPGAIGATDNVYLVVRHRNHVDILSNFPLSNSTGPYDYDFTVSQAMVYGETAGHKNLAPGIWGMFAGDGYGDGSINIADIYNSWKPSAGEMGYYSGDTDMNGQCNNQDKNDVMMLNWGESSQIP